ncbi:hypothetical protein Leryth_019269 [Lithospermum erythrorhizon]|nr:hypothetical protein Leryth_019269 [Lithospermum erythrorhizon]
MKGLGKNVPRADNFTSVQYFSEMQWEYSARLLERKALLNKMLSKQGLDSLVTNTISQASAKQRQERAGVLDQRKCYRLYTESAFRVGSLPPQSLKFQRINLGQLL